MRWDLLLCSPRAGEIRTLNVSFANGVPASHCWSKRVVGLGQAGFLLNLIHKRYSIVTARKQPHAGQYCRSIDQCFQLAYARPLSEPLNHLSVRGVLL